MATQELSAKDFRDDLIRVLAEKSDLKANRPVHHKDIYDDVALLKGVVRDQFGTQGGTKILWVDRWIQWAFKSLVEEGLGKRAGRGNWALTPQGVVVATGILQGTSALTDPEDETGDAEAGDTVTVTPSDAVSLMVGPGQQEDAYHTDIYIRALAAEDSSCHSSYSDKSETCTKCPLSGSCMNAMAAELSVIAAELAQEDKEKAARKRMGISDPKPKQDDIDNFIPSTGGLATATSLEASLIAIQQHAVCKHCGKTITKGADGYWVRSSSKNEGGLYHEACLKVQD